jgi:hypothetical protein
MSPKHKLFEDDNFRNETIAHAFFHKMDNYILHDPKSNAKLFFILFFKYFRNDTRYQSLCYIILRDICHVQG